MEPSELRISDTEREQAVRMLGEHMSDGRLDVDEYGERTAKATAAKTRGELVALFTDLPAPRPTFGAAAVPPPYQAAAAAPPAPAPTRFEDRPLAQRVWGAMVPLSALVALVLFLSVFHQWYVFLLPAAFAVVGGAIWGDDWRSDRRNYRHRDHMRDYRHQMRDMRRQMRRGWHD
jgi:uncharacterized protein DUF1707